MPTDVSGGAGLTVVAGDVLALRGTGLAAAETWALLCQAAQALQDLFLSNGGVVGGSRAGPVVTPHTLELTPRGRVFLQLAPPETARAYLPPEYRPGRVYSDTESEKMWMYSLGRALLDTTPRVAALTGTVSVSPSSALQSVLAAMTEPDPRRRASLMNLLDVISEYCRTRLQSKPFTHIVIDMYREVVRSPQYAARKRAAYHRANALPTLCNPVERSRQNYQDQNDHHHHQRQVHQHGQDERTQNGQVDQANYAQVQRTSDQFHQQQQKQQETMNQVNQLFPKTQQQPQHGHHHHNHHNHHHQKGALFKAQSRNSRSHPNLTSLCGQQHQGHQQQQQKRTEMALSNCRPQFQSQLDIQTSCRPVVAIPSHNHHHLHYQQQQQQQQQQHSHHHARAYSQPVPTRLQQTKSSGNLPTIVSECAPTGNLYNDPIYALPVKPFLSSQDVRVNGFSAKAPVPVRRNDNVYASNAINSNVNRRPSNDDYSQPEDIYERTNPSLQRQHSNPQISSRDHQQQQQQQQQQQHGEFKRLSQPSIVSSDHRIPRNEEQMVQQQNQLSSIRVRGAQGPPKPPRIITTLKKAPLSDIESNQSEPPAKPPRNIVRNGPRARRGKAVQRAPSRLYRTLGGPMRSFNKAQCVGPEFVVRANQPPKTLCVGQVKGGNSSRIVVIMLTGQRVEVTCDPQKVTAGDLFQAIVQAENLEENFTLGLAVLLAGDFAILPPETKLSKVAPPGWLNSGKSKGSLGLPTSFMLYLRLRFFLPSLRGIRNWISKHLLYLQIRRCILEQQLVCSYPELIYLTGLALQVEFGNYNANEHGCGDYFLLEHYVPESLILNVNQHQSHVNPEALRVQLQQAHRDRRGLDSNKAEEMFITHAQSLPDYGSHYYIASVDSKELEKVMAQQKRKKVTEEEREACEGARTENVFGREKSTYGRIENIPRDSCENIPKIGYNEERAADGGNLNKHFNANKGEQICQIQTTCRLSRKDTCVNNNNNNNNVNNNSKNKSSKSKKTDSNVWLAIHAQGLKLFERGGEPRERTELARFQWRDIQTLSYSKNCLVVYTKLNGKRCKFKLRMDHRKSYFAFKLTSLHHQFFLKLRSELTSLQGLAKDFGVPLTVETLVSPSKIKTAEGKTKIVIANTVKMHQKSNYPMQLEEYQNKENENPQKDTNAIAQTQENHAFYSSEEDALYAQVNVRLEPEGESRDTEDESEGDLINPNEPVSLDLKERERNTIYSCTRIKPDTECVYALPKIMSTNDIDHINDKPDNPEELYAAINKAGISRKKEFPVPEEVWEVADVKKTIHKMKTSSLPNYGTPRQSAGFRTPSLPRRLGVKMGTRAIYSSLVQKDTALADDAESMSLKSDTESSIRSFSARSTESPLPEAYVLNADIRTDDETFRVPEDESMSASLMARLEELSFAEERILHTIKLERGHGGSIGLQVTEGNDGGVYVQAVSVGGSADMAGNVNKGDRIVAINGQNLLNLRYEDALKMLQSSSETVELVLSQPDSRKKLENPVVTENNYLHDIRFDVSSEAETSSVTNKWLIQKTTDVASVQNTSSAYSSAASSAMGEPPRPPPPPPPPVPPRRRRRKIVNELDNPKEVKNTNRAKRVDRKRLPPPPPPSQVPRRNKTRFVQENQIQTRIAVHVSSSKDQKDESNECVRSADSDNTNYDSLGLGVTDPKPEELIKDDELVVHSPGYDRTVKKEGSIDSINVNPNNSCFGDVDKRSDELTVNDNNDKLFVCSPRYDRTVRREFNKYPPLFFTLDDIQNVIPDTFPSDEKLEESKMEKEEMESSLEKDQIEVNQEVKESFIDNCIEDESDVCFRVTPTNFPFEKCLDRWKTSLDGDDFGIDQRNNFIFEDYMDRSNALNVRRSKSALSYDVFDSDETTVEHTATKVRFVIESPSSSTPDIDIQDSLQNVDSITNEVADELENHVETSSRHHDADIFGEIPFCSVIESNVNLESHGTCSNNLVEAVENKEEEVRVNFPDSSVPSSVDDRFLKEQVLSNTEVERCSRTEELSPEHEVSKIVDRVNENLAFPEDLNESSNSRKQFNTRERRKIFVTQSLRSFMDDSPVDWEDNESEDGELVRGKLEIVEEKFSNVTISREEEQELESCSNVSPFVEPIEEICTLTRKETEVPVSVRRNSFLEQMLSDDCSNSAWNLKYCEIVAIHPKNDQLTLIEEQNEKDSNSDPTDTKNIMTVKTDVLNELLTNFATIKLKTVVKPDEIIVNLTDDETLSSFKDTKRITANEMAVQRIQAEINVSQKLDEDMKNSKISETDSKDSKYYNDRVEVAEIVSDIEDESNTENLDDLVTITLKTLDESIEQEGETGSAAKCAIVREKTPNVITHRNNDDNNRAVRTPVALSNDQSSGQESPTIIPGSVRSFVKYYEIRRETTAVEDSKINDRRTLDQRSNLVRSNVGQDSVSSRIRRFECKDEIKAARENTNIQLASKDNNKKEPLMNPESVSNEISYTMITKKVIEPSGLRMECVKGSLESRNSFDDSNSNSISEGLIKNDRKKSVQFSGEHTVIGSHGVDLENTEEVLEDGFSQPGQHLAQETHPRTDYERDSGINRFVSNAASNARLVFYCTV